MVNKHQVVYDWVSTCPILEDTLLFDFLNERNGSVALSPTVTDTWVEQYMRGGIKQYSFDIQAMFAVSDSTDTTNIDNMQLMQSWMVWLEEQQTVQNFPDFGPGCSDYTIILPTSMASQAVLYGGQDVGANMMAKYVFPATIEYYTE